MTSPVTDIPHLSTIPVMLSALFAEGDVSIYLRKSIRLGPMRVNLSPSGIGFSGGVPGLRAGAGPRGSYIRIGSSGVQYLATRGRHDAEVRLPGPAVTRTTMGDVVLSDVTGASTEELLSANPSALVSQLNDAVRTFPLWPLGAVFSVVMAAVLPWLLIVSVPLTVWLVWFDQKRRTVVAFYEVDGPVQIRYQTLVDRFAAVCQSHRAWHVVARGLLHSTHQRKVNAGAGALVQRQPLVRGFDGPKHLRSNIAIPTLKSAGRSVYFLPDRVLVRDGNTYVDVSYAELSVVETDEQFIEEGSVPSDAVRVGTTWKYVNKSGGPDRRFKDNVQLPVMRYGRLSVQAGGGLNIIWSFSSLHASRDLEAGIASMRAR